MSVAISARNARRAATSHFPASTAKASTGRPEPWCRAAEKNSNHILNPFRASSNLKKLNGATDFIDAASDMFTTLRLRAATALTSSLSNNERESLLESIRAVDESQVKEDTRKSIGEAVAAAVATEAERNAARWERERETLVAKAEEAAMARVQSDTLIQERRIALERWELELEKERRDDEEKARMAQTQGITDAMLDSAEGEDVKEAGYEHHHPILGEEVVDLGYKRVHLASASALATIPVWEKQRVYRHERAKVMANEKLKTTELGLPGVIALHEAEDGQLSILDGQHRVGMMAIMQGKKDAEKFDFTKILVEVFPHHVSSLDIFTEINKAEPVKLVDLPGVAKSNDRKIITLAAGKLRERYSDMFKPSHRCRAPHLNIDNLRDALFAADVLKRHSINSSKALTEWIMGKNEELGVRFRAEAPKGVSKAALEKAIKHDFFLGLDSSWLYH